LFTLEFWKATLVRAIRTFAESALAYIGTGVVFVHELNFLYVLSAGGMGFLTAVLLALATGVPEAPKKTE
jgi:hypothetical protein